jgi:tripartite-type tricarboxylate transporter receptor subunit TctC
MMKLLSSIVTALCLASASGVLAQAFPTRPVHIVVPFPPGGNSDFLARIVSRELSGPLGQPVVVENRAGASGAIAADLVAKSPPDGHTMLLATVGMLSISPHLGGKLPYDPARDFAPVTEVSGGSLWLLVNQSVPANNVRELIALAKAQPGRLNYASPGLGQATSLTFELFKLMAGVDVVTVHYKGSAPALNDVLGGQIGIYVTPTLGEVMQFVKAGRLRLLAVSSLKRWPAMPEVPTIDESGLKGFEVSTWNGLVAPARTPPAIVARLSREIVKVLQLPKVQEGISAQGGFVLSGTPEEFGARIRADSDKWAPLIKQLGIKLD